MPTIQPVTEHAIGTLVLDLDRARSALTEVGAWVMTNWAPRLPCPRLPRVSVHVECDSFDELAHAGRTLRTDGEPVDVHVGPTYVQVKRRFGRSVDMTASLRLDRLPDDITVESPQLLSGEVARRIITTPGPELD